MRDKSFFQVGFYIRLSREDGDKGESESISNQRSILQRYVKENNLYFVKEYVDDGVSGTTFDRPGFRKMLKDIEDGIINMVISKDLSRLGRDYIKTGFYIENYFPQNNIRYVAVIDGIDTYIDSINNDVTPFKAIMNDMYAKDISKKIRSVYREKQKQGEYICSVTAYGYKKHSTIKNKLIIDENVKDVVEKIFKMYLNGYGSGAIVDYLNKNKYLSPLGYRKMGIVQDKKKLGYNWNEVTICNMLKNEVYIGNTVQNKKNVISYKIKKIRNVEKENQIRVNNTHQAIIDKDTFDRVQCILEKRGACSQYKYEYKLRGLLYCYHCKRKLQIVLKGNSKEKLNLYPYITCMNAKSRGCYPLNINYNVFEKYIVIILKKICNTYVNKESLYDIYEKYYEKTIDSRNIYIKKIEQIEKEIIEVNCNIDKIYMDRLRNVLQEDDYIRISRTI